MPRIALFSLATLFLISCSDRRKPESVPEDSSSHQTARQIQQAPAAQRVIVFLRYGNIWAAAGDGTGPRRIVTGHDPEVSPDGKSIAFTKYERLGGRYIAIADIASQKVRRLPSIPGENSYGPRWSPDGKRLAFQIYSDTQWRIGLVDADDAHFAMMKAPVAETPFMTLCSQCWGRDGASILCHDMSSLYESGLSGKRLSSQPLATLLGPDTADYSFSSANRLVVSRDGNILVYDAEQGEGLTGAVFAFDRDSKHSSRVTPPEYHAQAPAWLMDGRTIVFSGFELTNKNRALVESDQAVQTNIYSIDLDGKNLRLLIKNAGMPSVSQ